MADAATVLPGSLVAADLAAVRLQNPLTQCITNTVVTGFTANTLLAVGASPAMVEAVEEAGEFAAVAEALLVNLGTLSAAQVAGIRAAVDGATTAGTPWVLDPVAVGGLRFRTGFAVELLDRRPTVVRGNASEIMSLAGAGGVAGRGVDSRADSGEALDAARSLAAARRCVVAVSGVVDYVTDGDRVIAVTGGHPLMTRVTGVGCALGALLAAFLAVDPDPVSASVAASTVLAAAGEAAAERAAGPGSFATALLDQLHLVDPDDLAARRGVS